MTDPPIQPQHRRGADRRILSDWEVHQGYSTNGIPQVVLRLGKEFETFIPNGMAVAVANALIDAVERNTTTTNHQPRRKK